MNIPACRVKHSVAKIDVVSLLERHGGRQLRAECTT